MENISGFGTGIMILALKSFPFGFSLSKFADDVDPIAAKDISPFAYELLYDGSIVTYSQTSPVEVDISVIPNSEDDINLKILLNNKPGALSILPFEDFTSMVVTYPDGGRVILSNGSILSGPPLDSISTEGRRKGNTYRFVFGTLIGAQNAKQFVTGAIQGVLGVI